MGMQCSNMGGPQAHCSYGADQCICSSINNIWNCSMCPAQEPMGGDSCPNNMLGIVCPYVDTTCYCVGSWTCNAPCPSNQPASGSMCSLPVNMSCIYGMTTCVCMNGQFFCN